jgi:hypothetical protein
MQLLFLISKNQKKIRSEKKSRSCNYLTKKRVRRRIFFLRYCWHVRNVMKQWNSTNQSLVLYTNFNAKVWGRGLKLKCIGGLHSQEKNALRAAVYWKKAFAGRKLQKNELKLIEIDNLVSFWVVRRQHKYIWRATCGPWGQFHQHSTRSFYVSKLRMQLLC